MIVPTLRELWIKLKLDTPENFLLFFCSLGDVIIPQFVHWLSEDDNILAKQKLSSPRYKELMDQAKVEDPAQAGLDTPETFRAHI
ncbi:MAG: hypothetical protein KAW52_05135 [candidate division Zixibacteria bacterium]|nr:hypothetical protein [candidate division Zixibacteria bacterium]